MRAVCITCGDTRRVSLKGIEGDSGVVKAETCDECHAYAKVFYQAKDMKSDPCADDLATLGLDVLVAEAGLGAPRSQSAASRRGLNESLGAHGALQIRLSGRQPPK